MEAFRVQCWEDTLQVTFFEIEMKLKELKQPPFVPPEGQRISDIEQAWRGLEKEEHMKNTALKMEILRQQKLEQLAAQFHQKIGLRNGYLDEMILVLSDSRYGSNLSNVEASLKKHQAISADILSRENRFKYFMQIYIYEIFFYLKKSN